MSTAVAVDGRPPLTVEDLAFWIGMSDFVLVCAFTLPLLSLAVYGGQRLYGHLTGSSESGGGGAPLSAEEQRKRDIALEEEIKNKASNGVGNAV